VTFSLTTHPMRKDRWHRPVTEEAVVNVKSLHGVNVVPSFLDLLTRGRYDIVQFGRDFCDFDIIAPDGRVHEGEKKWLETNLWAPERVLACANRFGKSLCSSVKLRHHALYQTRPKKYAPLTHDYRCCALSLTLDMARIVWERCYFGALEHPLYSQFVLTKECKLTPFPQMVIGGGKRGMGNFRSELWARTTARNAQYLTGHNFDFISWDEPSREPKGQKILDDVLRMRLPDRDGRLDLIATGNGKNWYYAYYTQMRDRYDKGSRNHYAQTGTSYDNPFISHDALDRAQARMSPELVRQNVFGGFADTGHIFPLDSVQACYAQNIFQDESYTFPEKPVPGASYAGGVDFGRLRDKTVLLIARTDESPARIVNVQVWGGERGIPPWTDIFRGIKDMQDKYYGAPLLGDATGAAGDVTLDTLINQHSVRIRGHQVGGSKQRKRDLILKGQHAIQGQRIIWPYCPQLQELTDQLIFYAEEDKGLDTDWVMAFCLLAMNIDMAYDMDLPILPMSLMVSGLRQYFDGSYSMVWEV